MRSVTIRPMPSRFSLRIHTRKAITMADQDLIDNLVKESGGERVTWRGGEVLVCFHPDDLQSFAALVAEHAAPEAIELLRWALDELAGEYDNNTGKPLSERYWTDDDRAKLARAVALTGFDPAKAV